MARRGKDEESVGYVPERDESGRVDRDLHRARMDDLHALTERLARLPVRNRRTLPLDEETLAHLDELAAAAPRADRRRLVLRTRQLLAQNDLDALANALERGDPATLRDQLLVRWRTRIVAEGDAAIQEFLTDFPSGDRQAVRTAAREIGRAHV